MSESEARLASLPNALRSRTMLRTLSAGRVPSLLAHPDEGWHERGAAPMPRPFVVWIHGRTVHKELDPGRYLRWQRAGIATCAIDLPGHGERFDEALQSAERTLEVAHRCAGEIDGVFEALRASEFNGAFDHSRAAIGGMSAGGIVTIIRLCSDHPFRAAAVEATAGDFSFLKSWDEPGASSFNPIEHLERWRAIPFLALHSEADAWLPVEAMRRFIAALQARYLSLGADPAAVEFHTWARTGAPNEHFGFGKVSNDAKNLQTRFLARHLEAAGGGTPDAL